YRGDECAGEALARAQRAARLRHQSSPEGRLDHRDRQREYVARQRQRVMDRGSEELAPKPTVLLRVDTPPSKDDVAVTDPQESVDGRARDDDLRDSARDAGAADA